MANWRTSSISSGATLDAFDAEADMLWFDDPLISAAQVEIAYNPTRFDAVSFTLPGLTFFLPSSIPITALFSGQFLFDDGSVLLLGTAGDADELVSTSPGANDQLQGFGGDDLLDGGAGADRMVGGNGSDTYVVDNAGDLVVEAVSGGIDTVQSSVTFALGAHVENLTLTGTSAIHGSGNGLANILIGNGAANTLNGFGDADIMSGGNGHDIYHVDHANDQVIEDEANPLIGGVDTVYTGLYAYTLPANVENFVYTGISYGHFIGNATANHMAGGSSGDLLDGGGGADALVGGNGRDTYVVDNPGDVLVETQPSYDDVDAYVSWTLGDGFFSLRLLGGAPINGYGNDLENEIEGNGADNILDGGGGPDFMAGYEGSDTYYVDDAGDWVYEADWDPGIDTVRSTVTYTLTDHVENLELLGTANLGGGGNGLDNYILGNSGANGLSGGNGNDTIDGGQGIDTMQGGAGNDTYRVDRFSDQAIESLSGLAGGTDLVESSITWTLSANLENLTLTGSAAINGTGNPLANLLVGNGNANLLAGGGGNDTLLGGDGNDQLSGGTGVDSLVGGHGNDVYFVDNPGDVADETTGSGSADEVRTTISFTLGGGVEDLRLQGIATTGTGNALDNRLIGNGSGNVLNGSDGADRLYGYGGTDTLQGGNGDDFLYGGGANDQLFGGAGRDILRGDPGSDVFWFDDGDYSGITNAAADRIVDFTQGSDRINLSQTDAVAGGADNAFVFIGNAAFTGVAGQLRYTQSAGVTLILGDTNGDGAADTGIALTGTINLLAGDFVL